LHYHSTAKEYDGGVISRSELPANDMIDDISTTTATQQASIDRGLRFAGVARLYASKTSKHDRVSVSTILNRLHSATVAVIGLGGIGSWSAESLVRSGIGNIVLIDLDDICISNTNRQLHATTSNIGKMKISIMKERLLDINPYCNVTLIHDFVTTENSNELLAPLGLTACIDAIDGVNEKTSLLLACVELGIPIVSCGGAAGRSDPTKIVCNDITKVTDDRLLFKCRKLMRQEYGFPKVVPIVSNKNNGGSSGSGRIRNWRIHAVYSTEVVVQQQQHQQQKQQQIMSMYNNNKDDDDNSMSSTSSFSSSFRTCDGILGTASFVTGTYGLVAACKVVEMIALDELIVPKKQGRSCF
jgi:tRNA A37 threonylcarbamoyladenosine dehydratase